MSVNVYNKTEDKLMPVAGGTVYADSPIGSIIPYGGSQVPSGWLLCDGRSLSKNDYLDLWKAIGYNFGGSGSSFNLPDLREATTKGVGLSGKSANHYDADGVALGEFIEDRLQGHEHKAYANASKAVFTASGGTGMDNRTSINTNGIVTDGSNGDPRIGTTTEVKAVGVNYIIKAKQVAVPIDIKSGVDDMLAEVTDVIPSDASASNKLVTESEISKTEKTLNIGGSASAIVKIDVSVPFLDTDYGKFIEIDFQVRSDNIRFFISANDGTYLVTAQYNYRSSGWLTGLNYLVNGSKSISLYVNILNYPATVGAKLVFNGLDGAEITKISTVSALPSGCATMKQFPIIYATDLTSTVTSGSSAPITSGGVYDELNKKADNEDYWVWNNQTTFAINLEDISNQRIGNRWPVLLSVLSTESDSHSPKTHLFSIGIIATASSPVSIISVGGDGGFSASASGWIVNITCPHSYNNAKLFF